MAAKTKDTEKGSNKAESDHRPDPKIIELYEYKVKDGRICVLCGKWLDRPHERSAKHEKQVAYVMDLDETNKAIYLKSCRTWVEENMMQRGGAKRKAEEALEQDRDGKARDDDQEDAEPESSGEVMSDALEEKPAQDDLASVDEDTIATTLNALLPPARSNSDNEHDGDRDDDGLQAASDNDAANHDDMLTDNGQDNDDNMTATVEYDSDIEEREPIQELMVVNAGNRRIGMQVCHHTTAFEIVSTIALEMRLMVRQTALVRGSDMLVFNSGCIQQGHTAGTWKAWKLPLALEQRQEPPRAPDEELDRVEDKRCDACQQGWVHTCESHEGELGKSQEEENLLMSGEDRDVVLLQVERSRDKITWQVYKDCTVGSFLDEYAMVKRVRRSALTVFEEIGNDKDH